METKEIFRKRKTINIDIFNYNLIIVIGEANDMPKGNLRNHLKFSLENKRSKGKSSTVCLDYNKKTYFYIFIDGSMKKELIYEALFHELDHQKFRLMERKKIKDSETSAYITSYFARNVKEIVKELLTI
jgi:hypothetical protein